MKKNNIDWEGSSSKPAVSNFSVVIGHLPDPPPLEGIQLYINVIGLQQIMSKQYIAMGLVIKKSCPLPEHTDADYAAEVGILYSLRELELLKRKCSRMLEGKITANLCLVNYIIEKLTKKRRYSKNTTYSPIYQELKSFRRTVYF